MQDGRHGVLRPRSRTPLESRVLRKAHARFGEGRIEKCRYRQLASRLLYCNIYVRSIRAGERVMASVSRFLTTKLRLKVNKTKSAVARPEERKFLGFSISNHGGERRIAPKALDTFKRRIWEATRRPWGRRLV